MECKTRISIPKFGKFLWRILQNGKENRQLPVWSCVYQPNLPKLQSWKWPRWSRNPVWPMEYTRMVQLRKMWKDVNQLRMCAGLYMNILPTGNKLPVQRGFFKNDAGDLLPTLRFLGRLYNFCNFVIIFTLL